MYRSSMFRRKNWQHCYRLSCLVDKLPTALGHLSVAQLARDSLKLERELVDGDKGDHYIAWFA
jgi:hypothetical protein